MAKNYVGERFVAEQSVNPYTGEPVGSWCVVDYAHGAARHEALTRKQAEIMAADLNAEADSYIVVRQDTLEAVQGDGTWGARSTGHVYRDHDAALEEAARQGDAIGRLVGVQDYQF
jgi:hypothetical protein